MMVDFSVAQKLMSCFQGSVINEHGEFIAHLRANVWFCLAKCESELDVKCKVLEWFSRPAYKSQPFSSDRANKRLWKFMQDGINQYLGTQFSDNDFERIYTWLGNEINRNKTVRFIESGYDMNVLRKEERDVRV